MNAKQQQFELYANMIELHAKKHAHDNPDMNMTRKLLFACASGMREAALGHARYDALSSLTPNEYETLWKQRLKGGNFDDLLDNHPRLKS